MKKPTTCPSCSRTYAGVGGEDALLPVILACLCVICKGCALTEEAKAQQQQPGGGEKERGRKWTKEARAHANGVYELQAVEQDARQRPAAGHCVDEAG